MKKFDRCTATGICPVFVHNCVMVAHCNVYRMGRLDERGDVSIWLVKCGNWHIYVHVGRDLSWEKTLDKYNIFSIERIA